MTLDKSKSQKITPAQEAKIQLFSTRKAIYIEVNLIRMNTILLYIFVNNF